MLATDIMSARTYRNLLPFVAAASPRKRRMKMHMETLEMSEL